MSNPWALQLKISYCDISEWSKRVYFVIKWHPCQVAMLLIEKTAALVTLWLIFFIFIASLLCYHFLSYSLFLLFPLTLCQDSEDEWVELQPQTQTKAWQVPSESKPSESDVSPTQNVQVTSSTSLSFTK